MAWILKHEKASHLQIGKVTQASGKRAEKDISCAKDGHERIRISVKALQSGELALVLLDFMQTIQPARCQLVVRAGCTSSTLNDSRIS